MSLLIFASFFFALFFFVKLSNGQGLLGGLGLCGPPQPMCQPPPMCPILPPPMPCPPPLPPCPPCPPTFCPPPIICPPPVICPPPPLPCPPQLPCTCPAPAPYLTGPPMGAGGPPVYSPMGMGGQSPYIPSNDCCCGCASPCSFRAAYAAKLHGARIFSASNTGEGPNEDPTCNSEKLRQAITEHITSDPSESKRAIQKAAEERLFAKINVICANGDFSYVAYTDAYCQATSGKVTCYAFRPLAVEQQQQQQQA